MEPQGRPAGIRRSGLRGGAPRRVRDKGSRAVRLTPRRAGAGPSSSRALRRSSRAARGGIDEARDRRVALSRAPSARRSLLGNQVERRDRGEQAHLNRAEEQGKRTVTRERVHGSSPKKRAGRVQTVRASLSASSLCFMSCNHVTRPGGLLNEEELRTRYERALARPSRRFFRFEDNDVIVPIYVIEDGRPVLNGGLERGRNARQIARVLENEAARARGFASRAGSRSTRGGMPGRRGSVWARLIAGLRHRCCRYQRSCRRRSTCANRMAVVRTNWSRWTRTFMHPRGCALDGGV